MHNKLYTLVGMSGVGKTSIGKALSKALDIPFLDTDHALEAHMGKTLHEYMQTHSQSDFLALENELIANMALPTEGIISTGGSVIYCKDAMKRLKKESTIIYLKDTLDNIIKRIPNIETRGIASPTKIAVKDIYKERLPLYKAQQDITITIPNPFHLRKAVTKTKKAIDEYTKNH